MFTVGLAYSYRRDDYSPGTCPIHALSHPQYAIGAESGCSDKDYISQLPLHRGGTMALDVTHRIEHLLSPDD